MLNTNPMTSLLALLEQRIEQMDVFDSRSADDLDVLLRCREKTKMAANTASTMDRDNHIEMLKAGAFALCNPGLIQELLAPSLDVV